MSAMSSPVTNYLQKYLMYFIKFQNISLTFWHNNIIDDRISSVLFLVSSSNSYARLSYLPFHSTNNQVRFDTLFHQSIQLYLPLIETLQSFNAHIFEHDKQNFKSRSGNYHKLNLKRIIRSENWKMKA